MAVKIFVLFFFVTNVVLGKSLKKLNTFHTDLGELNDVLVDKSLTIPEKFETIFGMLVNLEREDLIRGINTKLSYLFEELNALLKRAFYMLQRKFSEFVNIQAEYISMFNIDNLKELPEDFAKSFKITKEIVKIIKKELHLISDILKNILSFRIM
ncbi:unnamed protein product [Parnassius apollo]|uniref:(apollo) hypothetical protein n=1 Tax=Parnassius apollo TaxID=110799 RepID=A0A8S3W935_PARAO|nr:unnamed protein product [Parnassius apollo]